MIRIILVVIDDYYLSNATLHDNHEAGFDGTGEISLESSMRGFVSPGGWECVRSRFAKTPLTTTEDSIKAFLSYVETGAHKYYQKPRRFDSVLSGFQTPHKSFSKVVHCFCDELGESRRTPFHSSDKTAKKQLNNSFLFHV